MTKNKRKVDKNSSGEVKKAGGVSDGGGNEKKRSKDEKR